jgi:hypothetical protein
MRLIRLLGLFTTVRLNLSLRGSFTWALVSGSKNTTTLSNSRSRNSRRPTTALFDSMTDTESGRRDIVWLDEVDSTMDAAKELLAKDPELAARDAFAVVAGRQTRGRGTRGRTWMSKDGNLFMTAVLKLPLVPVPLTLIPLRVGTLIAPSIKKRVHAAAPPVTLKWPNDVLIGDHKVCGVLIEVADDRVLVGIGCNVRAAPEVEASGQQYGRLATCVADHAAGPSACTSSSTSAPATCPAPAPADTDDAADLDPDAHKEIAAEIFGALAAWLTRPPGDAARDTADGVLRDFERDMDRSLQRLRGDVAAGETVLPVRLNPDGTLRVTVVGGADDGSERTLVADYLV